MHKNISIGSLNIAVISNGLSLATILALTLSGCGGNSKNNGSSDNSNQATLLDSTIEGVDYYTLTKSGTTDKYGHFDYSPTDKLITFSIGNLKIADFNLSKIKADKKVLVSELFGLDRNNTTDERVIKLLRFVQTLDSDGNVSNGITIDTNTKGAIDTRLDSNSSLSANFLDNNISALETIAGQRLVSARDAREHYKQTIRDLNITPDFMPFVTVWEVNATDRNITIPINSNYDYNYTVDWGDGSISKDVNNTITHTYSSEGNYTVKISGEFPAIYLSDYDFGGTIDLIEFYNYTGHNADKILKIKKWGDIEWKSFESAFGGANKLEITASDTPNLKKVKDMSGAFVFYPKERINNIEYWDVSNVTNMSYMFAASSFNQPLNGWNVSNVTNMEFMFYNATSFNQPLNDWNVSNVTNMSWMFEFASKFDQNISGWNVSKVIYHNGFAYDCPINGTSKMPNFL